MFACHFLALFLSLTVSVTAFGQAPPRTDLYGDPLPEGALLRLGTTAFRVPRLAGVGFRPSGELVALTENLNLYVWPADGSPKPTVTNLIAKNSVAHWMALSQDARFAAAPVEHRLIVWDLSGPQPVEHLSRDARHVPRLAFSADGAWLAYPGPAKIHLCKLAMKTWEEFPTDVQDAQSLSFTPDGKSLVVVGLYAVTVIDTATHKERFKPQLPRMNVSCAAMSPDGTILAVLPTRFIRGPETVVRLVSAATGKEAVDLKPPTGSARWIDYSADGKTLLLGGPRGIHEWDPVAGKLVREIAGPAENPVIYSADRRRLASHSVSAMLLADTATGRALHPELIDAGHTGAVMGVTISPDGKLIATNSLDSEIRVWSADTGRTLYRLRVPWGNDQRIAFQPDSKSFIAVAEDYVTPVVYSSTTGRELRRFVVSADMAKADMTGDLRLSADGKTLNTFSRPARGDAARTIRWDVATGRVTERSEVTANIKMLLDEGMGGYSPDGRWLVVGGTASRVGFNGLVQLVPLADSSWTVPHFSNDSRLVTFSLMPHNEKGYEWERSSVAVFDLTAMAKVVELPFKGRVLRHVLSPDDRKLAVVGLKETVVFDLFSGKPVRRFQAEGLIGRSPALAFTPDGRRLITGHDDCTALVWDISLPNTTAAGLTAADCAAAWTDLANTDAAKGFAAVCRLADEPAKSLPFLKDRLRPAAAPPAAEIQALLNDLSSAQFSTREAAEKSLRAYGDRIETLLRDSLKAGPSAEAKRRIDAILAGFATLAPPDGETLRGIRAVWVLERIGTPAARQLLAELAKGVASARLTREAVAALARMAP